MYTSRNSRFGKVENKVLALIIVMSLLDMRSQLCVDAVQFFHYPVAVPAIAHWRVADGFQFQVQNPTDGTYHFGYAAGTGTGQDESYREERRDSSGRVSGRYGYVDPTGILRTVEYIADQHGFRSRSSDHLILDNANIQVVGPIPKPIPVHVVQMPVVQSRQAGAVARRFRNKEIKAT